MSDKKLITIALQLVRDHYCHTEQFDESCIELERWCYDHDKPDLAEYATAHRCPACAFVPMNDVEDEQSAKLTAERVQAVIFAHSSCAGRVDGKYFAEDIRMQAIADELNAVLGSDAKPCYAADENYKRCKYSVNRGWCDDAPFLVWDDTGHLFITMGGLKTWDVTDDAKKWFAELGSGTANAENALALLDEMNEAGLIAYGDYSRLHDAISALGSSTCDDEAEPDGWHKCQGCGCVVGYWLLVDGSWTIYMDDYQIPYNNCPQCGARIRKAVER